MKAIQCGAPSTLDDLTLVNMPTPRDPGVGDIMVRIEAASLNYHDYAVVTGLLPTAAERIPLSDGAGRIVAIGEGVEGVQIGDLSVSLFFPCWTDGALSARAAAQVPGDSVEGYACEYVTAPACWFTRAPQGYSAAEASTVPCAGVTAWRALVVNGQLNKDQTVLVLGSGGVSVFALQLAKALGARVIATTSSNDKADRLRALGADHVINYRETPKWGAAVLELTNGAGADHVVEIGGAGTLDQSIVACRPGGHIALVGVLAGFAGPVNTAMIMRKQLRVQGLTVGSRVDQLDLIEAFDTYAIKPVIDRSFPLSELAAAFRYQGSGSHVGKIVVEL